MADFIDDEASEASSSDEELSDQEMKTSTSKAAGSKKKKSKEIIDSSEDEEELSDQEVRPSTSKVAASKKKKSKEIIDSSEEEDDDEEEADDVKDLINDDSEEENEGDDSDDSERGVKRAKDDDESSSSLDSDDIDLIEENAGVRVQKKKKFKRIKNIGSDDSDGDDGRANIARDLFGSHDLVGSDDEAVTRRPSRQPDNNLQEIDSDDDDDDDDDEEDNFIVDDDGQPLSRPKKKGGNRHANKAMQEAQEVFGVDFDFDDLEQEDDAYDDFDEYDGEYEDEEGQPRARRRPKGNKKSIQEVYEPAELERFHLTHTDQQIRARDVPERFQLRSAPITEADDKELEEEAEWIFANAFAQKTISIQEQDNEPIAGKKSEIVKPEIVYTLKCIRNENLEVPFISAYRREYVPSISSNFDDTQTLWTIYNYDKEWYRLKKSKERVAQLYRDMRDYLQTLPEDPRVRKILDTDISEAYKAKNGFEIDDHRLHFMLYYSSYISAMKLSQLQKQIKEKETNKQKKKDKFDHEDNDGSSLNENGVGEDGSNQEKEDEEEGNAEEENQDDDEQKLYIKLTRFKISNEKNGYQKCREDYVGNLVEKFGLTPEDFGENLRDDYQRHNVKQHPIRPIEEAGNHLKPGIRFHTREDILKAAKFMFSREISCNPLVRQTIRKFYFENAVIQVKPTEAGMREIDENHPCYLFKYLRNKPVVKLQGDQFLLIQDAEKLKLLDVKFTIEPIDSDPRMKTLSSYYESLRALYFSDYSSLVTKEWNEQREEAVSAALDKYLLPCFEKELREKLTREAQEKIIKICREKLQHNLNIAPYTPPDNFEGYDDFELRNGTRICGFTFAPDGDAPCFAAVIDVEGELLGHTRLPNLNLRKRPDRMHAQERENQAKDRVKFKQFIMSKKPHVIALAAETVQTQYICQDLAQILDELHKNDGQPEIFIELVDSELSTVYKNLKKASDEFADFPPLLLQAISIARKLNDPLTEYAKLCSPDDDITCLRFHPLQDELPKEELLECLTQEFVTRTNAVGVDVNRAIEHPHTADLVQFLSGLGPRKGAHLLRSIKKSTTTRLVSRQQLVHELGMTSIIFINCAGFIKLDTDFLADYYPDEHVTPLDSTRIHPESYVWAKKIASDALDYEEGASEETTANAIEEILENPEKLDDLDLGAFAKELDEVQNKGKKAFTLTSIRDELANRYKDHRELYKPPNHEEIFEMLTKETPYTFYIGKLVTCKVIAIPRKKPPTNRIEMANPTRIEETNTWKCPFCLRGDFQDLSCIWNHFDTDDCPGSAVGLRCKLDNGLTGFIHIKFISDKEIHNPEERVSIGDTIHARIIKIDTSKLTCELSCRTSDLLDKDFKLKPMRDVYYDQEGAEEAKRILDLKSRRAVRRGYTKRIIVHPAFMNIDYLTCEKKLAEMEQGAAIIRPSSKGQTFLTASWKVAEGIHQHINIREEGKDNAFSLGNQLFIDNEAYEDLDEIIARHIQPMALFARDLLNYKYCIRTEGVETEKVKEILIEEKQKNPHMIHYRFCPLRANPGKFLLGYIPSRKVLLDNITVTPSGFRFRKEDFKTLSRLIKWFKDNWSNHPPITPGIGYETGSLSSVRQTFPMSQ